MPTRSMGIRTVPYPAILLAAFTIGSTVVSNQAPVRRGNPFDGDADAIRRGTSYFQTRCADCHGIDARGVLGPDLTDLWASGVSDERLFQTIRRGVPGTDMPSSTAADDEIWQVLAYLRTLEQPVRGEVASGNATNGERLYWTSCGGCHRVNGKGGHLGPDLSLIGSHRSRATLTRDIREASAVIAPGYQPVTIVTADGARVRGARKAEDAFSIQIMDAGEQLRGFLKKDVRQVTTDARSLMPDFGADRLNDRDLEDLLSFLSTLRNTESGRH